MSLVFFYFLFFSFLIFGRQINHIVIFVFCCCCCWLLSRYNIINQIFRPNHIPKQTMNVQKNTHSHIHTNGHAEYKKANMMHDVYTHTHTDIRQKANVDIARTHHTDHGPNRCTVIKAFLQKKRTFQRIEKGKEENIIEACGFVTIKMTNCMAGHRRAFEENIEQNLTCILYDGIQRCV